jgi:hypothetical protein
LADFVQIDIEDGNLDHVGPLALVLVHIDQPEELIAQIELDRIVLLGARPYVDLGRAEFLLQIFLQLDDFFVLHKNSPLCAIARRNRKFRPRKRNHMTSLERFQKKYDPLLWFGSATKQGLIGATLAIMRHNARTGRRFPRCSRCQSRGTMTI